MVAGTPTCRGRDEETAEPTAGVRGSEGGVTQRPGESVSGMAGAKSSLLEVGKR